MTSLLEFPNLKAEPTRPFSNEENDHNGRFLFKWLPVQQIRTVHCLTVFNGTPNLASIFDQNGGNSRDRQHDWV